MLTPMKTSASARPRRAGSTNATAMPAATGVNIAPMPISTRPSSSIGKASDSAHTALPAAKIAMPTHKARRRGQPPVSTKARGASTAVDKAYTVIICPAAATLMFKAAAMLARMPAGTKAPVPMTRLHRASR